MPFYVTDYFGDTTHLNTVEHGAYLLLILHYWQKEGLPSDDEELAIITRLQPREWKKMRPKIARFFGPDWRHKRVDAELARAAERYERRAKAGKAGGNAKSARLATGKQCSSNAARLLAENGSKNVADGKQEASSQLPTHNSHPYGSPGRSDRVLPSQDCGDLRDAHDAAPAEGWDERNPFGADDDGEAAA